MKTESCPHTAIVFDFGGVLVDWDPHYLYDDLFGGDAAAVDRFLREIDFAAWNLEQDRGRPFKEAVAVLCAQFPQYADLISIYDRRYPDAIRGPIAGTVEILRACRSAPYRLFGLSNWSTEKFNLVRPRYEFFSWFDEIVLSGAVRLVKPDPAIFALFLRHVDCRAEECVYIDDSVANVTAAAQLGFCAVRFTSPAQLAGELDRLGVLNGQH